MSIQLAGLCFTNAEGVGFHHDLGLVALSYLVAVGGSFAALEMIERWRHTRGAQARPWQIASAVTLGCSIWCMHFVAMLALEIGLPMTYAPGSTLLRCVIATSGPAALTSVCRPPCRATTASTTSSQARASVASSWCVLTRTP